MPTPVSTMQYNFNDPESRIMKSGNSRHFEQSYNAQAAVEVQSMLIVSNTLSYQANDKQELLPVLAAADSGSFTGVQQQKTGKICDDKAL